MLKQQEIEKIIRSGDHWKAKELLQGRLSNLQYDVELFEAYGYVLLNMSDKVEAGKYLFLSGVRKSDYSEAIALYLNRYSRGNIRHIYHTFPKAAQAAKLSDFPSNVISEMEALGYEHGPLKSALDNRGFSKSGGSDWVGWIIMGGLLVLLAGFLTSAVRGLIFLAGWLSG